jgi:hypothetical protein
MRPYPAKSLHKKWEYGFRRKFGLGKIMVDYEQQRRCNH